jgi:hypothetical protein
MEEEKVITKEEVTIGEVGSKINYDVQSKDFRCSLEDYKEACKNTGVKYDEAVYKEAMNGIGDFTAGMEDVKGMRKYQLTGKGTEYQARVDAMEKLIKTMPHYEDDIYRGMHFKSDSDVFQTFTTLSKDNVFDIDSFSSFSKKQQVAEFCADLKNQEAIVIKINGGVINSLDINMMNRNEILVNKTSLKVISNEMVKGSDGVMRRLITCVEVP